MLDRRSFLKSAAVAAPVIAGGAYIATKTASVPQAYQNLIDFHLREAEALLNKVHNGGWTLKQNAELGTVILYRT